VRYPPARLRGTPGEAEGLTAPRVVFAGTVRQAAALFPRHLNVSVGVALAGLGMDRTEFTLIADPGITQAAFLVEAEAGPGAIRLAVDGRDRPVDEDPADYTTFSVLRLLRRRQASVMI
jgi:aspartate dehydrogenase